MWLGGSDTDVERLVDTVHEALIPYQEPSEVDLRDESARVRLSRVSVNHLPRGEVNRVLILPLVWRPPGRVVVLYGGPTPYMLLVEEAKGHCSLVGECYLEGRLEHDLAGTYLNRGICPRLGVPFGFKLRRLTGRFDCRLNGLPHYE